MKDSYLRDLMSFRIESQLVVSESSHDVKHLMFNSKTFNLRNNCYGKEAFLLSPEILQLHFFFWCRIRTKRNF